MKITALYERLSSGDEQRNGEDAYSSPNGPRNPEELGQRSRRIGPPFQRKWATIPEEMGHHSRGNGPWFQKKWAK